MQLRLQQIKRLLDHWSQIRGRNKNCAAQIICSFLEPQNAGMNQVTGDWNAKTKQLQGEMINFVGYIWSAMREVIGDILLHKIYVQHFNDFSSCRNPAL